MSIVNPNVSIKDVTGVLVAVLIAIVGWLGNTLVNRIDKLSEDLNAYSIRMENRVTALEQHITKKE
jgi:predicted PurR-regulated permease PerM